MLHPFIVCAMTISIVSMVCNSSTKASDRFYRDFEANSPSGRFRVEAKSPNNETKAVAGRHVAFQSGFVLKCFDKQGDMLLWTRTQSVPNLREASNPPQKASNLEEGSPCEVYVNDEAWTVIVTGWNELIVVDSQGFDRGKVKPLDNLSKSETKEFVQWTTAGPMWESNSLWYFLKAPQLDLFVIRTWWGKRIAINLEAGMVVSNLAPFKNELLMEENRLVLDDLKKAVDSKRKLEERGFDPNSESDFSIKTSAAYLAGVLKIKAAIPFLLELEDAEQFGSSTSSSRATSIDGKVNPFNVETNSLRQNVQLAMRRLGQLPKGLTSTSFKLHAPLYEDMKKFVASPRLEPRHNVIDKITSGMSPELVIALIGEPDFIVDDRWEYDMDATPSCTLALTWGQPMMSRLGFKDEVPTQVIWVSKKTPPVWERGLSRDHTIND